MKQLADALGQAVRPTALTHELDRCVTNTRSLFDAGACSCAVANAERDVLTFVAADGLGADAIVGVEIPLGAGVAGWVTMSGQAVMLGRVADDPRFAKTVAEQTGYVPTSIMAAPLVDGQGTGIGVIEVLDPSTATAQHQGKMLDILSVIAAQTSSLVSLCSVYDALGNALLGSLSNAGAPADFRRRLLAFAAESPRDARLVRVALAFHDLAAASPEAALLAERLLSEIAQFRRAEG